MCRMIAFVARNSEELQDIYRAFRAGSQCDPYVRALGPHCTGHPDGWGYALYDGGQLHHFRSSSPVWEEDVPLPTLRGECVYGMLHSRFASDPSLNSPISSHPFVHATDREILLFAHNGGINVEGAAKGIVDTEWALSEIVRLGGLENALPRLKEQTKANSALNLMLLVIPRDQKRAPTIQCVNFYKSSEPGRVAYYKMYTADLAGGKIFFSSTFKDLGINGLTNAQEAHFGELFKLENAAFGKARAAADPAARST